MATVQVQVHQHRAELSGVKWILQRTAPDHLGHLAIEAPPPPFLLCDDEGWKSLRNKERTLTFVSFSRMPVPAHAGGRTPGPRGEDRNPRTALQGASQRAVLHSGVYTMPPNSSHSGREEGSPVSGAASGCLGVPSILEHALRVQAGRSTLTII